MAYSTSSINIQLIKKEGDSKNDDMILIKKNLEYNEFELTYVERDGSSPAILFRSLSMSHAKVLEYVYILLKNQSLDSEPYEFIQVNNPAMPRVMFKGDQFQDVYYRDHVYEMVSTGLDLLDTTSLESKKKAITVKKATEIKSASKYDDYCYKSDMERTASCCAREGLRRQHMFFDEPDE